MIIYAKLSLLVSISTPLKPPWSSPSVWAEGVIEHLLSHIKVHFEKSFIRKTMSSHPDVSSVVDEEVAPPDDVYNNIIPYSTDLSYMESKWIWKLVQYQKIRHEDDTSSEGSEHFIEVLFEDTPSLGHDSIASPMMIRFSRHFPIFIGTLRTPLNLYSIYGKKSPRQ